MSKHHNLFSPFSLMVHLGSFQCGDMMSEAAMNILSCAFYRTTTVGTQKHLLLAFADISSLPKRFYQHMLPT